jgi:phosphocarrier protein
VERVETVEIRHKTGMHARPSTELRLAQRFHAEVRVALHGGSEVDGKSIIGVLSLGAAPGARIVIRASGEDAEAAVAALVDLVRRGFSGA